MPASGASFLFHDYETFGTQPAVDRACQFAALRTDEQLQEIEPPLIVYCQPSEERLPHPQACLITGITPQVAAREGLTESAFTAAIAAAVNQSLTCTVGYNNFRFDDEFTRNLLYRNLHDPYTHEWKNGNSRFDIIDVTRMYSALRPQGIHWPRHADGTASFRLEDLARANALEHSQAHDALSDVRATIALAGLLKTACPKLWQWALSLRDKHKVEQLLASSEMLLHSSSRYSADRHCTALVTALGRHPKFATQMIVYDLGVDPRPFAGFSLEQLEDLLYTSAADLPEDLQRLPVKTVKINRTPMLAPVSTLPPDHQQRLGIDLATAAQHREYLLADSHLARRIRELFGLREFPPGTDPDRMLYQGFFSNQDRALLQRLYNMDCRNWPATLPPHDDPRIPEMLFRYRARNHPGSLNNDELSRWREHCQHTLCDPEHLPLPDYQDLLDSLRRQGHDATTLDQLQAWALQLADKHGIQLQ